jgi:hypothetical protein
MKPQQVTIQAQIDRRYLQTPISLATSLRNFSHIPWNVAEARRAKESGQAAIVQKKERSPPPRKRKPNWVIENPRTTPPNTPGNPHPVQHLTLVDLWA